jgi:hypothetical protein
VRRPFFTFTSFLSLLLSLATVVLWVRSHNRHSAGDALWSGDSCSFDDLPIDFRSAEGKISCSICARSLSLGEFDWSWQRFLLKHNGPYFFIEFPHWSIAAVLAILPTVWVIQRRRASSQGHCDKCGYNLTANVTGVCPECGTAVKSKNVPPKKRTFQTDPLPPAGVESRCGAVV